jgi:hypothetical protein
MAQRSDVNHRSNDELARLLYQSSPAPKPSRPAAPQSSSAPYPPQAAPQPEPEPLASRRVSELGPQHWPLSERKPELGPLSHRDESALFAALSRGTKANLGREPTVPELLTLVKQINDARALVAAVDQAMHGSDGVYFDGDRPVFRSSAPRRPASTRAA